jgi:(p)ppGpp synthase/HD superfamily hydrolase
MWQHIHKKSKIVFDAIEFAVKAHSGQFRKGTNIPYIVHPLGVAKTLIEYGLPDKIVVAGILHDTVEDTDVTLEDIKKNFGEEIAKIVEGASEPDKSDTWENRKKHTIEYLKTAPMDVIFVSCADKLDNIKSIREDYSKIGEEIWKRFKRSKESQKWYYRSLMNVFSDRMKDEPALSIFKQFKLEVEKVFGTIVNDSTN